jgi:hypothetical protein
MQKSHFTLCYWLLFNILTGICLFLPSVLTAMLQPDDYLGYLYVGLIPMHLSAHIWLVISKSIIRHPG